MNILVSGSNGIIGRQLLVHLKLIYPNAIIYEINRTSNVNNANSISLDILNIDDESCNELFKKIKPSLFFHLAWNTNHADYLTSKNNILWENASIKLINAFYSNGGEKFIGIGSSLEYNWNSKTPFSEYKTELNGNGWQYGISKLNIYNYLQSLVGKDFLWCRIFFVFGPGQDSTRLVPLLIKNSLEKSAPIKINKKLRRDYISTFEIAKQIVLMTTHDYCGAVNICSGFSIQLSDLIIKIEKITQRTILISNESFLDKFEVLDICGSNDVIRSHFNTYKYTNEDLELDLARTISEFI